MHTEPSPTPERILVMGVGNPLMQDEGVGVRIAELLMAGFEWPDRVEVVDAGTMGYTILDLFRGVDRLLVLDAIRDTGHPAGTVLRLSPEELADNTVLHSLHDLRLIDVLQAADLMDRAPAAVCIGVQIGSMDQWKLELTPPVEAALPIACAAALDVLAEWDVRPSPRDDTDVHARIIEALRTYAPMPEADESSA